MFSSGHVCGVVWVMRESQCLESEVVGIRSSNKTRGPLDPDQGLSRCITGLALGGFTGTTSTGCLSPYFICNVSKPTNVTAHSAKMSKSWFSEPSVK